MQQVPNCALNGSYTLSVLTADVLYELLKVALRAVTYLKVTINHLILPHKTIEVYRINEGKK